MHHLCKQGMHHGCDDYSIIVVFLLMLSAIQMTKSIHSHKNLREFSQDVVQKPCKGQNECPILYECIEMRCIVMEANRLLLPTNSTTFRSQELTCEIPRLVHQTYRHRNRIPSKVEQNFKTYAIDFQRLVYDDHDCIKILESNFHPVVAATFRSLQYGAHKADLFRYAIMYLYGGIYLDIKVELIEPLNKTFSQRCAFYSVLSYTGQVIFQGILASPKNNPIFLSLMLEFVLVKKPIQDWLFSCAHMYSLIGRMTGYTSEDAPIPPWVWLTPKIPTVYGSSKFRLYLFQEEAFPLDECYDGEDEYGSCLFVVDKIYKIIKCRYADFPWDNTEIHE